MALRGNLNDFSLPDVFQLVTFSRKTGVLRIKREDGAEGSVWFRDGDVFFAQSNWHTEMLGERLVRAQRITPQALKKALDIRAAEGASGRRLGAVLIDEGYIGDAVLEAFVQEQIQETIFDLMRWDEGEFDFEELPEIAEEDIGLSISMENVIMEGSRRLDEWGRIKKKIPSMDVVFKMATAPGEGTFEISLKPTEWNLLLLVDGTRTVAEMAHETGRTDFEVARIVYGLFSAGLLEFTGDEEVERLRAEKRERNAAAALARAARRESEQAALAAAAEQEAAREATARARAEAEAPVVPSVIEPVEAATPAVTAAAESEPLFFSTQLPGPTAEDAAVLEEMMGAVLQHPAPTIEVPWSVEEAEQPKTPEIEQPPAEKTVPEEPATATSAERAPIPTPVVPGLELPLIQVLSAEDIMSDLSPLEQPTQTLDEALSAVAEVASASLIPEVVPSAAEPVEAPPTEVPVETAPIPPVQFAAIPEEPELVFLPVVSPESIAPPEPAAEPTPVLPEEPELVFLPVVAPASITPPESEPELVAEPGPVVQPEPAPAPAPEPAPVPAPEPAPGVPAAAAKVSSYELELMSLGLGELPSDLFGDSLAATPAAAEPFLTEEPLKAPAGNGTDEPIDLGALLESLDRESEAVAPGMSAEAETPTAAPAGFDADILREVAPAGPASGVISTDAFMEEMSLEPIGLSGGLTDELSALTGANRQKRPVVNVAGIPDRGVLKRDQSVDKDTLLRIIDGIKSL